MKSVKMSNGKPILVSKEDYCFLEQFKWSDNGNGYAVRSARGQGKIYMHRVIAQRMGLDCKMNVDHINRDVYDNRRENLRQANKSHNGANRLQPKNNTSGIKGVVKVKGTNLWMAQICKDRKRIYLGLFEDKKIAGQVYKDAARKLFGEFAVCE